MSVSSLTELHTPCQTLSFSKEQPLFKSVTGLNPVFQPILTVTIVTVNMGRNKGFSLVTDWNKCCSLLRVLKQNDWQRVCSSVSLYTDIFIGTSVLNCQTIKSLFLQILEIKHFFKKTGVYTFFLLYLWTKYELIWENITAQTVTLGANMLVCHCKVNHNAH